MKRSAKTAPIQRASKHAKETPSSSPGSSRSQSVSEDSNDMLNKMDLDEEDLPIVQKLISSTQPTTLNAVKQKIAYLKKKSESAEASGSTTRGKKKGRFPRSVPHSEKSEEKLWYLSSAQSSNNKLVVHFRNSYFGFGDREYEDHSFNATLAVYPINESTDINEIVNYGQHRTNKLPSNSFPKISINGHKMLEFPPDNRDSGGEDDELYEAYDDGPVYFKIESRSLGSEVDILEIGGLSEDLLMRYLIALIEPKLYLFAEKDLKDHIIEKLGGSAQHNPQGNTWFDVWKYYLNK